MTDRKYPTTPPPTLGGYRPSDDRHVARAPPGGGTHHQGGPNSDPNAARPAPPPLPPRPGATPQRAGGQQAAATQQPGRTMRAAPPPPPPHRPGGGRPPGPRGPAQGGSGLGWILTTGLVLFGLAAAGAAVLLFAMPTGFIRDRLILEVKNRTGRDLVIASQPSFTIYPSLGVSMKDVALSLPPGMDGEPFVEMKSLQASVALWPLLSSSVEIESIVLEQPVFRLSVDKSGLRSWDFSQLAKQAGSAAPVRYAQVTTEGAGTATDAAPAAPSASPARKLPIDELALRDVRIVKGTLVYSDARSGTAERVDAVDLALSLPDIRSSLGVRGTLTWHGEPLAIDARLGTLPAVVENRPADILATVTGRPLAARYEGQLTFAANIEADGAIELSGPSASGLAAWAGGKAVDPAASALPFDVKGRIRSSASTYTLTGTTIAIEKARATGDLAVTLGAARPIVKSNLKMADLDLDRLLAATPGTTPPVAPKAKPAPAATPPSAPAPGAPPASIEDLLKDSNAPGPRVQGFVARAGLSADPIDWSPLAAVDAGITLKAERVRYQGVSIEMADLDTALSGSVLKLTLRDLRALGGRAQGFVSVDPTPKTAASVGSNITFEGVSLASLLKLAGVQGLTGTARIGGKIAMAGQGASEREIAESLAGETLVSIVGGSIAYRTAGAGHALDALDLTLSATSLSGPLGAKGGLAWNGERMAFDATLATLSELADARPVRVSANVSGAPVSASYNGTLSYARAWAADGNVAVKTRSLRTLAGWLGTALPDGAGFGPFELVSKLAFDPTRVALTGTKVALDGETATGDLSIAMASAKPKIDAKLKLSGLDLNKYIADLSAPAARSKPQQKPVVTGSTSTKIKAGAKAPEVRGYAQRGGWSEEPMDLGALALADVDAKLAIGRLVYKKIKVGQSAVNLGLKSSVLKTNFEDVALYGGKGKGVVTVDATTARNPKVATNLDFDGVQALPFLKDAADLDWLDGRSKLTIATAGQGATERQLIDSLSGTADLKFTDGAIVGINIPGMIRSAGQGNIAGLKSAPSEKTDFSTFNSSWKITGGVAQNSDLQLLSPLLRVSGNGKVELGKRRIDYLLKPKIVASLSGQGGETALDGIEIPVKVEGPWEKPSFTPDLKGLLADPNKTIGKLKEIGKQLQGKKPEDILKGILGKSGGNETVPAQSGQGAATTTVPPATGTAPAPAPQKSKTEQFLDKLLNP